MLNTASGLHLAPSPAHDKGPKVYHINRKHNKALQRVVSLSASKTCIISASREPYGCQSGQGTERERLGSWRPRSREGWSVSQNSEQVYKGITHVVRSVTIFFEFPPCADYEKSDLLYAYKKLLCSFNSFVCNFKGFCTDKVDKL